MFDDFLSLHAASSFGRQLALADIIEERNWEVDIGAGKVFFGDDLSFPIQLIGTESEGDSSWLWAWANEASDLPELVLRSSREILERGKEEKVDFLTHRSMHLDGISGHELAMIASGLAGGLPYYRGPYDGGALFFLIEDMPADVGGPYELQRILRIITETIAQFDVNHAIMAMSFLEEQGFTVEGTTEWTASDNSGRGLSLSFDENGRITALSAKVRN